MTRSLLRISALALLLLAACGGGKGPVPPAGITPVPTAVGTPLGTAVAASVGFAGGVVTSDDGALSLSVPAGALAADTTISIQRITSQVPGATGVAYRLLPDGLRFARAASLTYRPADADLEGTALDAMGIAWQDAAGYWRWTRAVSRDATARTVTVATDHFTDFAPMTGFRLVPGSATVRPGRSAALALSSCEFTDVLSDDPRFVCEAVPEHPSRPIVRWTVAGPGSVSGGGTRGVYTAPGSAAPGAKAVVEARLEYVPIGGQFYQVVLLLAHITIDAPPAFPARYQGTVTLTGRLTRASSVTGIPGSWSPDVRATLVFVGDGAGGYTLSAADSTATIATLDYDVTAGHCALEAPGYTVTFAGALTISGDPKLWAGQVFFWFRPAAGWYDCVYTDGRNPERAPAGQVALQATTQGAGSAFVPYTDVAALSAQGSVAQGAGLSETLLYDFTLTAQ